MAAWSDDVVPSAREIVLNATSTPALADVSVWADEVEEPKMSDDAATVEAKKTVQMPRRVCTATLEKLRLVVKESEKTLSKSLIDQ